MSTVLAKTDGLSHEEWLKERQKGIGGSDAGAVAGVNRWKSPVVLYMEKVGEIKNESSNSEAAYWGNVMEDVVAKEFTVRTGLKVRRKKALLRHPDHDWMLANVDRMVVGRNEGLECKTASEYLKKEWEDEEIPAAYLIQCQHYMAVTGCDAWWIAVLVGGNKFIHKRIERDDELISHLIEIEKDFWENHVIPQNPPLMDGSEAAKDMLDSMYPKEEQDTEMELNEGADDILADFEQAKAMEKEAKEKKQEAQNRIKQQMGEFEKGFSDKRVVTWKSYSKSEFDRKQLKKDHPELEKKYSKESFARRFTVKEVK